MNIVPFIAVIGDYGDLVLTCPYTVFTDCGTGHDDFEVCIIEAPMAEAKVVFYNTFGHSAERVSQVEIGVDYTIEEIDTASDILTAWSILSMGRRCAESACSPHARFPSTSEQGRCHSRDVCGLTSHGVAWRHDPFPCVRQAEGANAHG